jgi:hypothetical protein
MDVYRDPNFTDVEITLVIGAAAISTDGKQWT